MMYRLKRVLSIVLCVALILTGMPFSLGNPFNAYAATYDAPVYLYINEQIEGGTKIKYADLSQNIDHLETAGWKWDADAQILLLSGFKGSCIESQGSLVLRLEGENCIIATNN